MDLENLSDEDYFDHLRTMFSTKGWQVFLTELADNAAYINSVEDTSDLTDLWFRKGQLAIISNVLNLEETTKFSESELDESPE